FLFVRVDDPHVQQDMGGVTSRCHLHVSSFPRPVRASRRSSKRRPARSTDRAARPALVIATLFTVEYGYDGEPCKGARAESTAHVSISQTQHANHLELRIHVSRPARSREEHTNRVFDTTADRALDTNAGVPLRHRTCLSAVIGISGRRPRAHLLSPDQ